MSQFINYLTKGSSTDKSIQNKTKEFIQIIEEQYNNLSDLYFSNKQETQNKSLQALVDTMNRNLKTYFENINQNSIDNLDNLSLIINNVIEKLFELYIKSEEYQTIQKILSYQSTIMKIMKGVFMTYEHNILTLFKVLISLEFKIMSFQLKNIDISQLQCPFLQNVLEVYKLKIIKYHNNILQTDIDDQAQLVMNLSKAKENQEDYASIISAYAEAQFNQGNDYYDLFNSINITIMSEYDNSRVIQIPYKIIQTIQNLASNQYSYDMKSIFCIQNVFRFNFTQSYIAIQNQIDFVDLLVNDLISQFFRLPYSSSQKEASQTLNNVLESDLVNFLNSKTNNILETSIRTYLIILYLLDNLICLFEKQNQISLCVKQIFRIQNIFNKNNSKQQDDEKLIQQHFQLQLSYVKCNSELIKTIFIKISIRGIHTFHQYISDQFLQEIISKENDNDKNLRESEYIESNDELNQSSNSIENQISSVYPSMQIYKIYKFLVSMDRSQSLFMLSEINPRLFIIFLQKQITNSNHLSLILLTQDYLLTPQFYFKSIHFHESIQELELSQDQDKVCKLYPQLKLSTSHSNILQQIEHIHINIIIDNSNMQVYCKEFFKTSQKNNYDYYYDELNKSKFDEYLKFNTINIEEETNSGGSKEKQMDKKQIKFQFGVIIDFSLHLLKNWFSNHPEVNIKSSKIILILMESLLQNRQVLKNNFATINDDCETNWKYTLNQIFTYFFSDKTDSFVMLLKSLILTLESNKVFQRYSSNEFVDILESIDRDLINKYFETINCKNNEEEYLINVCQFKIFLMQQFILRDNQIEHLDIKSNQNQDNDLKSNRVHSSRFNGDFNQENINGNDIF